MKQSDQAKIYALIWLYENYLTANYSFIQYLYCLSVEAMQLVNWIKQDEQEKYTVKAREYILNESKLIENQRREREVLTREPYLFKDFEKRLQYEKCRYVCEAVFERAIQAGLSVSQFAAKLPDISEYVAWRNECESLINVNAKA